MPRRATYPPVSSPRPCRTAASIPLWLAQRYGWNNQPNHITLRPETVQLTALKDAQFIGTANGIPPGYGGPQTPFWHGGGNSGGLENLPHNPVHTNIGGRNGLMSDPDLAGLDPVFWIHHSNIDRLWQVWLNRNPGHQNPGSDNWLEGPVNRSSRCRVPAAAATPSSPRMCSTPRCRI